MTVINLIYAHSEIPGFAVHKAGTSAIWSREPLESCDIYAYLGAFSYRGSQPGLDVLLTLEPRVVLPGEYTDRVWRHFDYVLTFLDSLAEQGNKFYKVNFPAFDMHLSKDYIKTIDSSYVLPVEEKKHAICMISGNKTSKIPGELYTKRVNVAKWFDENSDIPFDVYGRPPFVQLPNYRGELTPHFQKFATLAQYRFSLCFENIYDPFWSKGYLSEKLLDCLMCGTVPIYLGCHNIEEYIPTECFIDFRQFEDNSEFDEFMHGISDSEYRSYVEHIRNWVNAGNLKQYSMLRIYDKLLAMADPTTAEEHLSTKPWEFGLAAVHANRQWQTRPSPIVWSWHALASVSPFQANVSCELKTDDTMFAGPQNDDHQHREGETREATIEELHQTTVRRWFKDQGDSTLRLDYPLTEDSVVFDVGGYMGEWSRQIATRYNPYIYIFEPVPKFYISIVEKFKDNPKVSVFNLGFSDTTKIDAILLDNDGTSLYGSGGEKIDVSLVDIDQFFREHHITGVDLMKINIEGEEYTLLKRMLNKGIVEKCGNLQIQFHTFYPNAIKLRDKIRAALKRTHTLTYDYPFVWENWRKERMAWENSLI